MNKPTITGLYAVLLTGLFFASAFIYQSCSDKKAKEKTAEDLQKDLEGVADEYTPGTYFEEDSNGSPEAGDIEPDYTTKDQNTTTATVKKSTPTVSKTTSSQSTGISQTSAPSGTLNSSSGAYMVVAGNYLIEGNADEMVKKLKGLGFSSAEKAVFDLSQYYSVIVGRFDTKSAAENVSDQVKTKGVDNYVLKQK